MHRHRIMLGCKDLGSVLFLTITTLRGTTWKQYTRWWSSLIKAIRKTYGSTQYVLAREEGKKTGMKHGHAVLAGPTWIPHQWLSERWSKRSGAKVVWIETAKPGKAKGDVSPLSFELAKYCTKAEVAAGRKMVTYSKEWPDLPRCATTVLDAQPTFEAAQEAERGEYISKAGIIVVDWPTNGGCTCTTQCGGDVDAIAIPLEGY